MNSTTLFFTAFEMSIAVTALLSCAISSLILLAIGVLAVAIRVPYGITQMYFAKLPTLLRFTILILTASGSQYRAESANHVGAIIWRGIYSLFFFCLGLPFLAAILSLTPILGFLVSLVVVGEFVVFVIVIKGYYRFFRLRSTG